MTHVNNCRQMHRNLVRDHKQSVLSCFLSLFPRLSLSLCHFVPSASLSSSFCVSLLQEGQVLECSLINSIRVGAVPKVRPQKKTISSLSVSTTFTLVRPPPQHSVSYSHRDTLGKIWWDCHVRHVTHAVISQVYSIDRLSDLGLSVELSLLSFSLNYQIHQGHLQNINMKYLTHQYLYKPGWV